MLVYRNNTWESCDVRERIKGAEGSLITLEQVEPRGLPQLRQASMDRAELAHVVCEYARSNPTRILRAYSGVNHNCQEYFYEQIKLFNNYNRQSAALAKLCLEMQSLPLLLAQPEFIARQFDHWVIEPPKKTLPR